MIKFRRMRSAMIVIFTLCFALLLSGCRPNHLLDMILQTASVSKDSSRKWAQDHSELLEQCGRELMALYPAEPKWTGAEFTVTQISGDRIELWHAKSRELPEFCSTDCQALLEDDAVKKVLLLSDRVEFDLGGSGFGSQTDYYMVYYLPEDNLSGCFGFSGEMVFTEQDGGWLGRHNDPKDDNTFFYQCIGEHLYYCWAHF